MSKQLSFDFEENKLEDFVKENSLYYWCIKNNKLDLLKEWDYEKNGDITPKNISFGTDKKVWWIIHYIDPIL